MKPKLTWNDEAVATLTRLWSEGMSAEQISQRTGFTRNAVLGKVDRLGLPHRKTNERATKAQRAARGAAWRGKRILHGTSALTNVLLTYPAAPDPPLPVFESRAGGVPLIDRGPDQCAFPINNAGRHELHLFCGKPVVNGSPYCRACRAKMYGARRPINIHPSLMSERRAA